MLSLRRLCLPVLAVLVACNPPVLNPDEEVDCTLDGDVSGGIQGRLLPKTTPPAINAPGASVSVSVELSRLPELGTLRLCEKQVRWTASLGTASPDVTLTNVFGIAGMNWVMPNAAGVTATLTAEVLNSDPVLQVVFTTTTSTPVLGLPTQMVRNPAAFPEPQSGTVGQPAGWTPSVLVTEALGRPVPLVQITFMVTSGAGSLSSSAQVSTLQVVTGPDGIASVPTWMLGNAGVNTVQASVGGTIPPVTFTANVSVAPVAGFTLSILAGNNQTAHLNQAVAVPPAVRVVNNLQVGVAGIAITWTVVQGAGSFLPEQPATGSTHNTNGEGVARLQYFGPTAAGVIKLRASTTDPRVSPQVVEFTITGTPAP
jgi:hypothetical protein